MKTSNIAYLYLVRLKARAVLVQEIFAILGIAVGVALLFASQIASTSLNGSVQQLTSEIVGEMQFQIDARAPQGFNEQILTSVRRIPGVSAALPVLERQVNLLGPNGQSAVDLIGTDPRLARQGSPLLRHFSYSQLAGQQALALPSPVAHTLGIQPLQPVKVQIGTRQTTALYGAELNATDIGELVHSPVAIAPLAFAQRLTGMHGSVTRIFIHTEPGRSRQVKAALTTLAAGRLNVEPANFDASLFKIAAAPANQGEGLFSGISALVGFLFAINAMLMTLHLRQGLVRELRSAGATRWQTIRTLLFDALVLGSIASLLGLALGELLSVLVFRSNPGYLSFAFPVGSQRIVTWQSVAIAAGAGVLAACAGVLTPFREIWSTVRPVVVPERAVVSWWTAATITTGLVCLAATTVILLFAPQSAVLGCVTLVLALLLLLPLLLRLMIAVFSKAQHFLSLVPSEIAVIELRSPDHRMMSLAIAATGAVAVFGSVAIQGAHANLQHGLNRLFHDVTGVTSLWITPAGAQNLLATAPFADTSTTSLARLPGVQTVSLYHAGFLTYGNRRLWILAPPNTASDPIPPSQLLTGKLPSAVSKLREGGWAVVSQAVAAEHHLHIGQSITLPTPNPTTLRIAALTTNLGWPPGAVIVNPADYVRGWGNSEPSAYNLTLGPQVSAGQVRQEAITALGAGSGLAVQTAQQRDELQQTASRQGLSRLTQIATLVVIATILAMSAAMGTMIWQRRPRFSRIKAEGYGTRTLWAALMWESVVLLGAGCSIGATFGLYGQLLISHALATVTGFPVVFSLGTLAALTSFALVSVAAVLIVAVPGWRVARVPPYA
jgi:putative ABC transport system permease protein